MNENLGISHCISAPFGRRGVSGTGQLRRVVAAPAPALWPRAKATTAPEGQLRSSHGRKPVVADVQVEPEPRQGRLKHVSVAPTGLEQRKGTETRARSFPRVLHNDRRIFDFRPWLQYVGRGEPRLSGGG